MLRFAVVDDEINVAGQTQRCLMEACRELQLEAEVKVFGSGEEIICDLNHMEEYQIIFLDIEMEHRNGIDVSRYLRENMQNETTQLVYVSGKNGYDRQLFEFRPFSFIEKPATLEKLRRILLKYVRIYGEKQDMFEYKAGHGTYFVNLGEVLYFESVGRKVKIKTLAGELYFYETLQTVWEKVKEKGFFSTHKSFLVNYRFIKSFHPDCLYLIDDERIPVAKGKRQEAARLILRIENGRGNNDV